MTSKPGFFHTRDRAPDGFATFSGIGDGTTGLGFDMTRR